MKFDRKKLKAAIKEAESSIDGSELYPSNRYPLLFTLGKRKELTCGCVKFLLLGNTAPVPWIASERQILYAIAAKIRGKLTMKKKWVPRCDATGGRELVGFTQEMQNQLIGDAWKEFVLPEPIQPVSETAAQL